MRTASLAKLALTAAVGFGALVGLADTAQAETPPHQGGGLVLTTPTTKPDPHPGPQVEGQLVLPQDEPDPEPPIDPDLPIANPQGHGDPDPCPQISCDLEQPEPGDDPDPGQCGQIALCDELTNPEPGCNLTHGCEDPDPECHELQASCDLTDRPDEPGDDPGDEPGDEPDEGDEGDRGSLPRTGATIGGLVLAGGGLTALGGALKRLGRRSR